MVTKILYVQIIIGIIIVFATLILFNGRFAGFVFLGFISSWFPQGLVGIKMYLMRGRHLQSQMIFWLLGEIIKVLFGILMLFLIYLIFKHETLWLPLIVGLIVSLQVNIFALMVTK